ncbi:Nuclear receptor-binding protein [Folsomia candida]|uniref:Nuclear receptor-binding protein n=1 Tax=Folsomia candida TaxID=158441 RepID=A0A226EUU1_FOLCA|nr:Nuclear receptor-binding protein [Folsomia candida]
MTGSRSSNDDKPGQVANTDGEDSDDEESEILEESPCGRWVKRREVVDQRDVPGIDCAYLAMDTEEGVEVVWNEVRFSERKNLKAQEEKIRQVFDNLTQLEHPNIVKFHKYWMETNTDKPRVVFITEYMSSGSLKQFLKRTKKNVKRLPLQVKEMTSSQFTRRFICLVAIYQGFCNSFSRYLHSCSPPIIHGNLTCDTIFIQHNGLVKIGSESSSSLTSKADIYSFGMCALEMAALEIQGNGDSGTAVTEDHINRTIESLEQDETPLHDFIKKCLNNEPQDRPTAQDLLFHPVLFEVPSLKLLSAHALLSSVGCQNLSNISETISDEVLLRHYGPNVIVAEIKHTTSAESEDGQESQLTSVQWKMSDVPVSEKLEKFVEDVKFGIYPLTCFELPQPLPPRQQASRSPEVIDSVKSTSPEPFDNENRRVVNMMCNVKPRDEGPGLLVLNNFVLFLLLLPIISSLLTVQYMKCSILV